MGKKEKGQALLIIVLVMVVALTVGLSVASRSITNLRTSTEEASSQKALAAAEAGIEQAIKNNVPIGLSSFTNDTTYKTDITQVDGTNILLYGGNPVLQDNGIDVWLSNYSSTPANLFTSNLWNGDLTIKWGVSSDSCSNAAIEFVLIYGSKQSPQVKRYAFDPCSTRASVNHFTPVSLVKSTTSGKDFYYETPVPITIFSGMIGRVVPLYTNTPVALVGNFALPPQGSTITSVGNSGGTQRKVNVFQGYPEIPSEYFLYNLFSP